MLRAWGFFLIGTFLSAICAQLNVLATTFAILGPKASGCATDVVPWPEQYSQIDRRGPATTGVHFRAQFWLQLEFLVISHGQARRQS